MRVTGISPVRNANTAIFVGNVALTFSQDVNASTAANVRVISGQAGGSKAGTATVSNNVLTFDPSANFKPGEVLQVRVPATVQSQLGAAAVPHVHQFTTAAGAGPGLFSKFAVVNVGTGSAAIVVADLDGDGDFATTNITFNKLIICTKDSTGNFGGSTTLSGGFSDPNGITAGDVDGNGFLDIVAGNSAANTLTLNLNTGGTFGPASTLATPSNPRGMALTDIDGDLDLLSVSQTAANVNLLLNNGSGSFGAPAVLTSVGAGAQLIAPADLDGDLDFVVNNFTDSTVSVRLNQPTPVSTSFASGQGFFVRSTALSLSNAKCLTEYTPNSAQLFRSTPDLRPQLHLALRTPNQAEPDLTYIYFAPTATAAFDQ
jgi:hypothetical protein